MTLEKLIYIYLVRIVFEAYLLLYGQNMRYQHLAGFTFIETDAH